METLDYELLKIKRNRLQEEFPDAFDLRIHRAISWIGRAEQDALGGPEIIFPDAGPV